MTRKRIFEILFGLYVLGAIIFTPLAGIIHIIFLIYLSIKKEWQLVLIAFSIFTLGIFIGLILRYHHVDIGSGFGLLIHITFLGLNIAWAIYALKKIKYDQL